LKVQAIQRFTSTATAVEDLTAIQEGRLTDALSKFLVEAVGGAGEGDKKKKKSKLEEMLVVSEPKLGTSCLLSTANNSFHHQQDTLHPRAV
jgi:nucleolar protein 58